MKTVMKKLLSIALVAILLVSAVPFQAKATETTEATETTNVTLTITYDGGQVALTVPAGTTVKKAAVEKALKDAGVVFDSFKSNPEGLFPVEMTEDKTVAITLTHTHDYKLVKTDDPTCTAEGTEYYECECGDKTTKTIPATGHSWGDWTKGDNDKEVRTCGTCGATETRDVAAKDDTYTVTFIAGKETYTRSFVKFASVSNLPGAPDMKGYKFQGWFSEKDGKGEALVNGNKWTGEYDTYYAYYVESTDDNISTLSVYAKFYIGGVQQGNTTFLYSQDFTDGESMLKWLNNNETTTSNAIFSVVSASEYEWSPRYYYNYSGNEPLAEQNLIADGDKSIVVKVYGKKATEANVLVYVHQYDSTAKKYVTKSIHEMTGYTAGNTVTKSAVDTVVKKSYSGKNMTITGLYTDTAWEQLLAGQNPTAANGIKVADNGTMKIHVILKNGTASTSSSKADTTNPKTGDMIMVPVMVMVASAAAAAFVYLNSKKRAAR